MRRLHPLPGSTHSPHYIEHSRLSCGYSLTVDTCDLKHSRQRRSPSRTVAHSDTESACVLHLFGRARSRLLCPRSDRRTPSGLCRVSSHRSIHPACICLPPPPPSLPDPEQGPTTALLGSTQDAKRLGCGLAWAASIIFISKPPPDGAHVHMAAFGGSETAPMSDSEVVVCRHSRALHLVRRAIFPSPSLRGAWRGASRWRQSGGGDDR